MGVEAALALKLQPMTLFVKKDRTLEAAEQISDLLGKTWMQGQTSGFSNKRQCIASEMLSIPDFPWCRSVGMAVAFSD